MNLTLERVALLAIGDHAVIGRSRLDDVCNFHDCRLGAVAHLSQAKDLTCRDRRTGEKDG